MTTITNSNRGRLTMKPWGATSNSTSGKTSLSRKVKVKAEVPWVLPKGRSLLSIRHLHLHLHHIKGAKEGVSCLFRGSRHPNRVNRLFFPLLSFSNYNYLNNLWSLVETYSPVNLNVSPLYLTRNKSPKKL